MKESKIKTHIFISYARSDASEVASLLQRRLEGYRISRKLVSKDVPLPDSKYLRRGFVDKEDLSVSKGSVPRNLTMMKVISRFMNESQNIIVPWFFIPDMFPLRHIPNGVRISVIRLATCVRLLFIRLPIYFRKLHL